MSSLLRSGDGYGRNKIRQQRQDSSRRPRSMLLRLILLSVILNTIQLPLIAVNEARLKRSLTFASEPVGPLGQQTYRGSLKTIEKSVYPKEMYDTISDSEATDALIGAFDPDKGVVALPKAQPNILPSEQFPWDQSKEIYVLSGYHSLQSVQVIWQTLRRYSRDKPLATHVIHSLNVLWDDVLCAADTTPRSVSHRILSNRTAIEEAGQTRQCRDWQEVENFSKQNSACFKDLGGAKRQTPMIEEWLSCPPDSPYKKVVDAYLARTEHSAA